MAKEFAKKFYNSKAWLSCRQAYGVSKFWICEKCGKPNATDVHHIIELNEFNIDNPDVALNHKNFKLLCKDCHNREHHSKYSPLNEGYSFDSNGDIVYYSPLSR